ncbi:protein disulfide isomerase pTAC5, chloroplastic isoform X1 [Senna tora]|uniref:Protein disulfide isomerase pTAC5, chloroplastic isoform X1 n=1 Tax=Senna tora TaxID=362788 RepID=A0A834X2U2_9FABA|nr:protein disulfide isomerase pTAC5, chloroplastic isoform X1 [Senna tora]
MSSPLPLVLNSTVPHKLYCLRSQPLSRFSPSLKPLSSLHLQFRTLLCHCSINPSQSDREEVRWLREEQRWLREEQRWLREEQRWARERDSLLREISDLKLQIQALERQILAPEVATSSASVSDAISNVTALLQVLKDKNSNLIAESGSSSRNMVLEEKRDEEEETVKEVVVEETITVLDRQEERRREKRTALRKGSEGEEVREMQEALLKLGFYSGEEDMEYSSFSSGTERAVKTWQAALGAPEDGIMTAELLERLYIEIRKKDTGSVDVKENSNTVLPKDVANGSPVASMTEISEIQQTVVGNGDTEVNVSHQRVFLLGENRWEEPSRLAASKGVDKSKNKDATTKCLQCRGEGRLLCTECDGTGEPNIEPQFLEWVDEGASCPYCDGLGYTICDSCAGKTIV